MKKEMEIDRFKKLPSYARDEINSLRRKVDELREEIAILRGEKVLGSSGMIQYDCYPAKPISIPDRSRVQFKVGGSVIECFVRDGQYLDVSSNYGRIFVLPNAANVVFIRGER